MYGQYYNLWSTDNDTTVPNDEVVIKSVYDPSPVGYSLPASNVFTGFTTTGGNIGDWPNPLPPEQLAQLNIKGDFDKGYYFYSKPNKQGSTVLFPACGYRHGYYSGSLNRVSSVGFYWGTCPIGGSGGLGLDFYSGNVGPLLDSHRSFGFAVRSAEERE